MTVPADVSWLWISLTIVVFASVVDASPNFETTVLTFNAGLTPRIPYLDDRARYIRETLAKQNADVICLQEYWHVNDVRRLMETVYKQYPYSFSAVHSKTEDLVGNWLMQYSLPPCAILKMMSTFSRMWWYGCMKYDSEIDILTCAVKKAGALDLSQECLTCIVMSGIDRIMSNCVGSPTKAFNVPGLVLLSKRPLKNKQKVDFLPGVKQLTPRSYLYAEVDGVTPVICTHTTANLGTIYYEPLLTKTFSSWAQQNFHDARIITRKVHSLPRAIVMGDLNSGPTVQKTNVVGDFEDSYYHYMNNNFTDPYVTNDGRCTYCSSNPLVPYKKAWIMDHVLLKGFHTKSVKRIFDTKIEGIPSSPSDHYGIEVTVTN